VITRKSAGEIERMRRAGHVVAEVLQRLKEEAKPGVETETLDQIAIDVIGKRGGSALFKGYRGYPKHICTSVNEVVVHGIPGPRRLKEGDLLSLDVGVLLDEYAGDAAMTVPVGRITREAQRLMDICHAALEKAIAAARSGVRLSAVSGAIQRYVESKGCSVVRRFTGHGIGRKMHEDPQIPNYVAPGMADPVLRTGMTLAIEPMVNAGGYEVDVLSDGWTVVTKDGSLSAHFEHTIAVTDGQPDILTL